MRITDSSMLMSSDPDLEKTMLTVDNHQQGRFILETIVMVSLIREIDLDLFSEARLAIDVLLRTAR